MSFTLLVLFILFFSLLILSQGVQLYYLFLLSRQGNPDNKLRVSRLRQISFLLVIGSYAVLGISMFLLILPKQEQARRNQVVIKVIGILFLITALLFTSYQLYSLYNLNFINEGERNSRRFSIDATYACIVFIVLAFIVVILS